MIQDALQSPTSLTAALRFGAIWLLPNPPKQMILFNIN